MSITLAYFDGERGHLTLVDDAGLAKQVTTVKAVPGRIIQIDDGKNLPMLRFGLGSYGIVQRWGRDAATMGEKFARDNRATLFSTKLAYDRAVIKAVGR
jgi:hypothetical protein